MEQQLDIEMLKQECRDRGMDPTKIPSPQIHLTIEELNHKLNIYSHILDITSHFLNEFVLSSSEIPLLAVIADNVGNIIRIQGNETIKSMVESTGIKEGVRFTEEHNGINVISLAIRYKQSMALIGEHHYHEFLQQTACYSVPIKDRINDKVIGVVALMTAKDFANPVLLSLLSSVNNSIERELKLVEEKNRLNLINQIIIDTTNVGILILDKVGNIIDFNTYARNLTKVTNELVVGKNIFDLASRKYSTIIKEILNHKSFTDMETTILIDGKRINLLCDALPIEYEGELIGSFIQFRDVTEKKKAQEVLIKAKKDAERENKEKTNFLSNMSHELRTPLNAIYGFSHVLKMDVDDTLTEKEKGYVEEIHNASKHMLAIVNDLLDLSEVEAGPLKLNMTSINLNTLVEDCLKLVSHSIQNKNITVVNEMDNRRLIKVKADYTRLKQVVINLLSNAIKYNSDNGFIYIRSKLNDDSIELSVKDTGIGISPEDVGKVYDKFFRTTQSRNIIEGSGIGLAISKQLVEKMGGTISVNSNLDEGSVFTLHLKNSNKLDEE